MKSYKQLITGIIIGATAASAIAFAGDLRTFVATEADFPVVVDGQAITLDMPVVTIEDRTYLPLRAMGDVLGVSVDWDGKQAVVTTEVTTEPSVTPAGLNDEQDFDKRSVDGFITHYFNGKYYVSERDILNKYKGDYAFHLNDDGTCKISWRDEVFFESYPQHTDGSPELEWYNTVLQPWLVEKCK